MPSLEPPDLDRTDDLMELEPAEVMARYRAGHLSRREIVKLFGALGLSAMGASLVRQGAVAADDLKLIIWEGYADDTYRKPFEDANKVTVSPTEAGTGDEMFALMRESDGKNYDLVSASSDLPRRLYDAGLLAEIDTSKLTNYGKLYDQFKTPDYITFDGKLYGVNFAWGPTIVVYNTDEITTEPTSWNALLDEQYSGKIATWNYPIQIAQYALLLDPKPANPYELTDEQLAQVKDILVKQRPLVRKYWDLGGEVAELFKNKEIVIADGWSWITLQVKGEGGKVAEAVPAEGVTGWSDSWCISKNAKNYDLALKWADWMIGDEGQQGITEVMNYSITNKEAAAKLPPERQKELRLTDVATEYAKIHMWRFIPAYDKWVQVWNEATQG
ncbi:MAG: putative spermidine/putrescine transport system substrate-binding protein [Thermomicrobiales bacterium]|jgi:putative spermidine/putrescine transport system substrate-binding protein/spermidine/putrescine transport system substrate-binding protein|nr:putative spermidine/putrescine transport system substrate-binding protein [Thermomicrobiales bacterium]